MTNTMSRTGQAGWTARRMDDETARQPSAEGTLAVAAAGTLLVLVAMTLPLTTLTRTAADLELGSGGQAWVLSGMSLSTAAVLLSSGAIGDDYGRRRTFLAGLAIMALFLALGACAPNGLLFIVARVLQGLGSAPVLACSLGLIGHAYPAGPGRVRATGIWGAALGAGAASGPILAVVLTDLGGWRLAYGITALAVAALAVAGRALVRESRAAQPRPVDLVGTAFLGLGIAALLAGLVEGRSGWLRPPVLMLLGAGLVLVVGFILAEQRSAQPMLDLRLCRRPAFLGATLAALAAGAGVLSIMSLVPTMLERGLGYAPLAAAVALLAWSATSSLTAFGARWVLKEVSPRLQLAASLAGCAVGQLAVAGLDSQSTLARVVPGMLLAGAANGVLNAALGRQAVASVPADRAAMGSGANNTARYLGSAFSIALITVTITRGGAGTPASSLLSNWNLAACLSAGFSLVGALAVLLVREPAEVALMAVQRTDSHSVCLEQV